MEWSPLSHAAEPTSVTNVNLVSYRASASVISDLYAAHGSDYKSAGLTHGFWGSRVTSIGIE